MRLSWCAWVIRLVAVEGGAVLPLVEELIKKSFGVLNWNSCHAPRRGNAL